MQNYIVRINVNSRFQCKSMQKVGSVNAKSKREAVEAVYAAFWGEENEAVIDPRMSDLVGPSSKSRLVAEID